MESLVADLRHIREDSLPANPERKPLTHPVSKMSRLRAEFEQLHVSYPADFPLEVIDPGAAGRLRCLLGLDPLPGQQQKIPKQFNVGDKPVHEWLGLILHCVEQADESVKGSYIVGSAASFIAGRRPILRGLTMLCLARQIPPATGLAEALEWRSRRCVFPYGDVDIHIELEGQALSELATGLRALTGEGQVSITVEPYDDDHLLIVRIKDHEQDVCLDVTLYTRRASLYIVKRDALRVRLDKLPGEEHRVSYACPDPWGWWRGHMLRLLERPAAMPTLHHCFSRVINLQGRKCLTSLDDLEERLFGVWEAKRYQLPHLINDLAKQLKEHESCAVGRQVNVLRLATVIQQHPKKGLRHLLSALNDKGLGVDQGSRLLYEAIRLLEHGSLPVLELLGLCGLIEGWSEPFTAKLERHGSGSCLRLRFRGPYGKRDLLLRYDPRATVKELRAKTVKWNHLRPLLHLAWEGGIQERARSAGYHRELGDLSALSSEIKAVFLHDCRDLERVDDICLAHSSSLAAVMIAQFSSPSEYVHLAELLIAGKAGSSADRVALSWRCLEALLESKSWQSAAQLIQGMREQGWLSLEDCGVLLARVIAYPDAQLWQACLDRELKTGNWESLPQAERYQELIKQLDAAEVPAELYLTVFKRLKTTPASLSSSMLLRLHQLLPEQQWLRSVQKLWCADTLNAPLCTLVTARIMASVEQDHALPFQHAWLLDFITDSQRFAVTPKEKVLVFKRLAKDDLSPRKQEQLLRAWGLKDAKLWTSVVQAHLRRQPDALPDELKDHAFQDPQAFVQWKNVLLLDKPSQAQVLLSSELKEQEPPGGRHAVAAAWISRWPSCKASAELFTLLLPQLKKLDWQGALACAHTPQHLLQKLCQQPKPSRHLLALCSLALLNLRPDRKKHEFVMRAWSALLQQLASKHPDILQSSLIKSCLALDRASTWNLALAKLPAAASCHVVADYSSDDAPLDIKQLNAQLAAARAADPTGQLAIAINQQHGRGHQNLEYREHLRALARLQLQHPQGDLSFAATIYERLPDASLVAIQPLPDATRLFALMRRGAAKWVADLLCHAQHAELNAVPEALYHKLLSSYLRQLRTQRLAVLLHPREDASFLREIWEQELRSPEHSCQERCQLLSVASAYHVVDARLTLLAQPLLASMHRQSLPLSAELGTQLLALSERLPVEKACRLWCQLKDLPGLSSEQLGRAALSLIRRCPQTAPDALVSWLFKHKAALEPEQITLLCEDCRQNWSPEQLRDTVYPYYSKHAHAQQFEQLVLGGPIKLLPSYQQLGRFLGGASLSPEQKAALEQLVDTSCHHAGEAELHNAARTSIGFGLKPSAPLQAALLRLDTTQLADPALHGLLSLALGLGPGSAALQLMLDAGLEQLARLAQYPELRTTLLSCASQLPADRDETLMYKAELDLISLDSRASSQACCDLLRSARPTCYTQPEWFRTLVERVLALSNSLETSAIDQIYTCMVEENPCLTLDPKSAAAKKMLTFLSFEGLNRANPEPRHRALAFVREAVLAGVPYTQRHLETWVANYWFHQDYSNELRDWLRVTVEAHYSRMDKLSTELLHKYSSLMLRLGVWCGPPFQNYGTFDQQRFKQDIESAVDEALRNPSEQRLSKLATLMQDLARGAKALPHLRPHPELCLKVQAAIFLHCSPEQVLANLEQYLLIHMESPQRNLADWTPYIELCCGLFLRHIKRGFTPLLDFLVERHEIFMVDREAAERIAEGLSRLEEAYPPQTEQEKEDFLSFCFIIRTHPPRKDGGPLMERYSSVRDLYVRETENDPKAGFCITDVVLTAHTLWLGVDNYKRIQKEPPHRYVKQLLAMLTPWAYQKYAVRKEATSTLRDYARFIYPLLKKHISSKPMQQDLIKGTAVCFLGKDDPTWALNELESFFGKDPKLLAPTLAQYAMFYDPDKQTDQLQRKMADYLVPCMRELMDPSQRQALLFPTRKVSANSADDALQMAFPMWFGCVLSHLSSKQVTEVMELLMRSLFEARFDGAERLHGLACIFSLTLGGLLAGKPALSESQADHLASLWFNALKNLLLPVRLADGGCCSFLYHLALLQSEKAGQQMQAAVWALMHDQMLVQSPDREERYLEICKMLRPPAQHKVMEARVQKLMASRAKGKVVNK